jgi:valyl-tRNA synthetase
VHRAAARAVRSEHEIKPGDSVKVELHSRDAALRNLLEEQSRFITFLVRTDGAPAVLPASGERPKGAVLTVAGDVDVLVHLRGLVDPAHEKERVECKLKKIQKDLEVMAKRLTNEKFIKNAPPEVVEEANAQKQALQREQVDLTESLKWVDELKV